MPELRTISDVVTAITAVTEQVSAGVLSVEEGEAVCAMIEVNRKAQESLELERRIAALEAAAGR
jgi:hypothetical protein